MEDHCLGCGNPERFLEGGFGLDICLVCGLCKKGAITELQQYISSDRTMTSCTYTRKKRFRKYLMRANRNQSANTVAPETWEHLMKFAPFGTPGELHRCLKAAKHLKRKCYDCMPLMCAHLCTGKVPSLSQAEFHRALVNFNTIDRTLRDTQQPMISYLFCLEFILKKIGRDDMVPYINRIKCSKRRQTYSARLRRIFAKQHNDIADWLRIPITGKNL